jgi:hypothetical protein
MAVQQFDEIVGSRQAAGVAGQDTLVAAAHPSSLSP